MKKIIIACSFLVFSIASFAQYTVKGTTVEGGRKEFTSGEVIIKGTEIGTLVENGEYSLDGVNNITQELQFINYNNVLSTTTVTISEYIQQIDSTKKIIYLKPIILKGEEESLESYAGPGPIGHASNFFVSVGIGLGGSGIVGIDAEYKFIKIKPINNLSVQAGVGYTGFDAGINYTMGDWAKVGTLDLGFQYRYTGFGSDDVWGHRTSNMGPVLKFRGNKWFVAQIGAGYILDTGEAYSGSEERKIQVHGGIGIYFSKWIK